MSRWFTKEFLKILCEKCFPLNLDDYMESNKLSFHDAILNLAEIHGIEVQYIDVTDSTNKSKEIIKECSDNGRKIYFALKQQYHGKPQANANILISSIGASLLFFLVDNVDPDDYEEVLQIVWRFLHENLGHLRNEVENVDKKSVDT